MKRFSLVAASLLAAALIASLVTSPLQAQSSGPKPPITDPQLGKPKKDTQTGSTDTTTTVPEAAATMRRELPLRQMQSRQWPTSKHALTRG
ncbi:MAG: hypothetical protein U0X20_04605 [Caldilineaceae bacterium]